MTLILGGTKKAAPLKPEPQEFRPLVVSPAMRAVQERCQTPKQVGMSTRVDDRDQLADRCENWRKG